MPPPTNGVIQKILAGAVLAALAAGGGALITQAQLETKVKAQGKGLEAVQVTQTEIRVDLATVKEKVENIEDDVQDNGDKLDRILEKLP